MLQQLQQRRRQERPTTLQGRWGLVQVQVRFYFLLKVGIGAGIVSRDTEDTSLFSVATNVPGQQEVDETLLNLNILL